MCKIINFSDHKKVTQSKVYDILHNYDVVELVDGTTIPVTKGMLLYCLYNVEKDTLQFIEEYKPLGLD